MAKQLIIQAFKYGIVGVLNTLITAVAIWLMLYLVFQVQGEQEASSTAISVSNVVGYVLGLINSFIWNRSWTFKSTKNWKIDLLKFIAAFLIGYIPQLLLVIFLNQYVDIPAIRLDFFHYTYTITSAYICQLIGILFYTVLNFLCNKYYTFK